MNILTGTIAFASTTAILAGPAYAQGDTFTDMIAALKLPVNDTAIYFNAATQTVERVRIAAKPCRGLVFGLV